MKFSEKYLSIPPYISTSWSNVKSLQMSGNQLVVTLSNDSQVHVPDLDFEELEKIFEAHAYYLEHQIENQERQQRGRKEASIESLADPQMEQGTGIPLKFGFMQGAEGLGAAMQHNIEHANAPDLPKEILQKIASIATIIAPGDMGDVPQPEPHCNCPHCQIARAINEGLGNTVRPFSGAADAGDSIESDVEEVSEEDLSFQQWSIQQTGERLFSVTNKLDPDEKYSVFLGEPVGCTCGKPGCEHILAVLHS